MAKERFKVIPAVCVIFEKDDQIAVLKRFNTGYMDGMYTLPSGHVDGGESFLQAAIRESQEEVGVTINPENLVFSHFSHKGTTDHDLNEYVFVYFICKDWEGELYNAEPEKCGELIWVDKNNLPENIVDHIAQGIEHVYQEEFYSDFDF